MNYTKLFTLVFIASFVGSAHAGFYTDKETLGLFKLIKDKKKTSSFWAHVAKAGTPLVEEIDSKNSRVIFLYRSDSADIQRVAVAQYGVASFDQREWEMTRIADTDVWYLEKELPVGTRLVYAIKKNPRTVYMSDSKRLEDVAWGELIANVQSDPFNKSPYTVPGRFVFGEKDTPMSIFQHPQVSVPKYVNPHNAPSGDLQEAFIPSDYLPEKKRGAWIYTPPGYDPKDRKHQRLLVVFDGDAYTHLIRTPVILDNLIHEGAIPKTIAVLIRNPDPNTVTRLRDLISGEVFFKFISKELLDWLSERYAFNPSNAVLAGSSEGGWAACYTVLQYPKLFSRALCQSPAFSRPLQGEDQWLLNRLIEADLTGRKFFIDVGVLETAQWPNHGLSFLQSARVFRDFLKLKKIPFQYMEFPGAHDYISWEATLPQGLKYLLSDQE